ncbi:MAG: DUF2218 domain-containing protein [Terricaulis sp.]|nr:DUF2218 domain-containing protein [Terricaulis sp.]
MAAVEADFSTQDASRYLQQLCKHWAHKFAVTFTPEEGRVPFNETSVCVLKADGDALHVRVEASDEAEAARMGDVVYRHLARFSFRDPLPEPVWRAA